MGSGPLVNPQSCVVSVSVSHLAAGDVERMAVMGMSPLCSPFTNIETVMRVIHLGLQGQSVWTALGTMAMAMLHISDDGCFSSPGV